MSNILFDSKAVNAALDAMAAAMRAPEVNIVGIQRGGALVADALQARLEKTGAKVRRGDLDISFYRDDLDTIGPNPSVRPSNLPFDVSDAGIWLVDDVLYTGRTIRAALGEIFDYGRPASVKLAVLVDRGGRELPVAADCIGFKVSAPVGSSVKLVTDGDWHIMQRQVKG
ncbi:MAG TPA: bifunctional pyr operon transcriptional regulator/uracil phosphoribosyltransferase PyrR [Mariprofundaceae bacterium]|nr:bifunctional pyr operon transcriptional regulator/uracil phosphoribosyltransferase PyrR [Mariprofundaceae bacterium]